jgi:hypothetical protein
MAFMCEAVVGRSGGLASTDIAALNTPPVELATQRLQLLCGKIA